MVTKDSLIIVMYLDIRDVEPDELYEYINRFVAYFKTQYDDTVEIIYIPYKKDTKIECINPKLLNDEDFEIIQKTIDDIKNCCSVIKLDNEKQRRNFKRII